MQITERCLIYLRNSGDARQSSLGKTLENQERLCIEFAQSRDYEIVDIIQENPNKNTSGADMNLPGFQKMIAMAERGAFDVLISRDVDRVARNQSKFFQLRDILKIYGIRIELYDFKELGQNTIVDGVRVALAEDEKDRLVKKLQRGRKDVVKNDRILKSPSTVYGYTFAFYNGIDAKNGYKFEIIESQAEIVKLIFNLCLEGMGNQAIADYLNSKGIPTPKGETNRARASDRRSAVKNLLDKGIGLEEIAKELSYSLKAIKKDMAVINGKKDNWQQSTVNHILKNVTYTGIWHYNKMSQVKIYDRDKKKQVKKWVKNLESDWITIADKNIIPPIIDSETFDKAQQQIKDNTKLSMRNTKGEYLVSKRVKCQCGASVIVHTVSKPNSPVYTYYKCDACRRSKRYSYSCNLPTFTTKEVDTKVWDKLGEYILNPQKLEAGLKDFQAGNNAAEKPLRVRLEVIEKLLATNEAEFDNALQNLRYAKGERAKQTFANDADNLEKLIAALKDERIEIHNRLEAEVVTDNQIKDTIEFAKIMAEDWQEISEDFDSRREFIDLINVSLILMEVDGKRKGLLSAKLTPKPIELCFDNNAKFCIGNNNKHKPVLIRIVIDFD